MMKRLSLVILCFVAVGCSYKKPAATLADQIAFRVLGSTPINKTETLTMKEIHLDSGGLVGRTVVVKGAVVNKSEHDTFIVVSDETARLLVVLTDLEMFQPVVRGQLTNVVGVMGTVESGKKGLPFLKATAIHLMNDPS